MQKKYDNLDSYLSLAKKTISKFGSGFYSGLSIEMLNDNDAVSDVATAIMYADWRFDPNRKGKGGQSKTLYSYRNQCAIWSIKTYITNRYKKKDNLSIDFDNAINSISSIIENKKDISPIDTMIMEESNHNIITNINKLLQNNALTTKQREQIKLYYFNNMTLSEIGKKFDISREAVRQNIKRGLSIIREHI